MRPGVKEIDDRERVAKEMYGADLYRAGYVLEPGEGEQYWDQLTLARRAAYRRRAAVVNRVTSDAMAEISKVALTIPDPARAITGSKERADG